MSQRCVFSNTIVRNGEMHPEKSCHTFMLGMTNTAAALKLTRETMFVPGAGDRIDVPNFAIVITDGQSNVNPETTLPESVATRLAAIQIIVVSVGEWFNSNLIILMFRHTTVWTMCSVDGVILPCGVCR